MSPPRFLCAALVLGLGALGAALGACQRPSSSGAPAASASASAPLLPGSACASASAEPAASASAEPTTSASAEPQASAELAPLLCPKDMVAVPAQPGQKAFCIDQYEASLVDKATGATLSPYYPPHHRLALRLAERWEQERQEVGSPRARQLPVPPLPDVQKLHDVEFMAVSRRGVTPNGYLSGIDAERACKNAGKRLCKHDEWITACQGQQKRQFPYGDSYQPGQCNICRSIHPAVVLHNNPSIGHLDPRLNLVKEGEDPLLRLTGATDSCKSEWAAGAAYDMNGNLDEWVEDEKGRFVGGFFSRGRKDGCRASITSHPRDYFDYSTGVRCCLSD